MFSCSRVARHAADEEISNPLPDRIWEDLSLAHRQREGKRRWSDGIHQPVEATECLKIQAERVVVAQIKYQSLFRLYSKLWG